MLYRLVIILAFHVSSSTSPLTSMFFKDGDDSQIRRQPTTYTQRSSLYRLSIILAFRLSSSTSPLTSNDLLFFKDGDDTQLWRSPTTYERRSPLYRLATTDYIHTEIAALSTSDVSSSTSPLSSNDLLFIKDGDGVQLWRPPTTYAQFQHFI